MNIICFLFGHKWSYWTRMTKEEEHRFNVPAFSSGMKKRLNYKVCSRCGKPNLNYKESHEK